MHFPTKLSVNFYIRSIASSPTLLIYFPWSLIVIFVLYTWTLNIYPLLVEFDCRLYFTDLIFRPQWYPSSPPWHDCSVYLETYPSISPPYFYSHLCPWWQSTTFFSNLIVVCLHSTLYLMIHALIVAKFDWHMSPLTFALTLKIPVPNDIHSPFQIWCRIFPVISVLDDTIHPDIFVLKWCFNILPTPSSCLGYVSPCYVIHPYFSCVCMQYNIDLDDKIHPVTFVLKWCFNIHLTPSSCLSTYPFVTSYTPILVAYACSIILTSTP